LTGVSALLDLETVTKASLAIASEIQIDKLLYTLMQVISENVAANKSALILQKEGNLILVAQCMNEHECKFSTTPINDSQHLPLSIINYVANMQEYLLISDATNDQDFANDSYIIQHQSKSILCNPILNKGQLIGILYLENNLTVGAFTIDRLRILNLLSSQAAISLENAQLYSNLEEKVTQRTQELNENNLHLEQTLHELKATQSQLIQTEKMSSLGQMVAGIAHEINNPVNFIYVQIAIKDNGMGINPEIKQRIFDPFFTTKPVGEGTGLGLSISYQIIVDKHSGKLDCISAPGKGTEFIIEIPIKLHQQ
jgi:signal transduction histidine kinase